MSKQLIKEIQAKVIAEAGANEAFSILATNFNCRTNDDFFPQTAYHTGSYDVTVDAIGDDRAVITSAGTVGEFTAYAMMDAEKSGGEPGGPDFSGVAPYTFACGGNFAWVLNMPGGVPVVKSSMSIRANTANLQASMPFP